MEEEGFLYPLYAYMPTHTGSACIDNSSFVSGQWLLVFVRIQGGSNVYHFPFARAVSHQESLYRRDGA